MTIPEIRDRLVALADEHGIAELRDLAEQTRRRSPLRRVRSRWPTLTEDQKAAVRAMFHAYPTLGVKDIADRFNTSVGRVSEAIRGFR